MIPEIPEVPESEGPSPWGDPAPAHEDPAPPLPISENGSAPVARHSLLAPGWPLGAGYAVLARRREHRVLRGVRSVVVLTVMALALGVAVAASLGVIVWLIAAAIHHAAAN